MNNEPPDRSEVEPTDPIRNQTTSTIAATAYNNADNYDSSLTDTQTSGDLVEIPIEPTETIYELMVARCNASPHLDPRGNLRQDLYNHIAKAKERDKILSDQYRSYSDNGSHTGYSAINLQVAVHLPLLSRYVIKAGLVCSSMGLWVLSCGLQTQNVRPLSSQVFEACEDGGDVLRLQRLFMDGEAHPNDVDSDGHSLVYHAIRGCYTHSQYETALITIAFLTRCGVDSASGIAAVKNRRISEWHELSASTALEMQWQEQANSFGRNKGRFAHWWVQTNRDLIDNELQALLEGTPPKEMHHIV